MLLSFIVWFKFIYMETDIGKKLKNKAMILHIYNLFFVL